MLSTKFQISSSSGFNRSDQQGHHDIIFYIKLDQLCARNARFLVSHCHPSPVVSTVILSEETGAQKDVTALWGAGMSTESLWPRSLDSVHCSTQPPTVDPAVG